MKNDRNLPPNDVEEILAEIAVLGDGALTDDERIAVEPWSNEISEFEMIAAQLIEQQTSNAEDMPADFTESLVRDLEDQIVTQGPSNAVGLATSELKQNDTTSSSGLWMWAAVAAALVVGVVVGRVWPTNGPELVDTDPPTLEQQFASLKADSRTQVYQWSAQEDPSSEGASGEVYWNEDLDEGFMTFDGFAANDPRVEQYQLWVFDEARSAEIPVDGGVFDVASVEGTALVKINTNLSITKATLFAITVEKPGGVMKSDRSRLPLLAEVK